MTDKIAFIACKTPEAQQAYDELISAYGKCDPKEADIIVALGGDGFMLNSLHKLVNGKQAIYGMNCGSVGFLMNKYSPINLKERLTEAEITKIHPLEMNATGKNKKAHNAIAFNEVSLLRQRHQAAKLRVSIDSITRLRELICDGIIIATPAGSTAYNLSVHGPILPIGAQLLAITPISAFRPRRWHGAIIPSSTKVTIEIINHEKRPVSAAADHVEFRDIIKVEIKEDKNKFVNIMFDRGHSLEERVLREQFQY